MEASYLKVWFKCLWKWLYSAPAVLETVCNFTCNSIINDPFSGGSKSCFPWMLGLADASQTANPSPVQCWLGGVGSQKFKRQERKAGYGSRGGTVSGFLGD